MAGSITLRRIAVVSDIHANVEALDAVLQSVDTSDVDELWCLGDIVGNGHAPVECIDRIELRAMRILAGNHDLLVSGALAPRDPHAVATPGTLHSRRELEAAGRGMLERLSARRSEQVIDLDDGRCIVLAHGCPDPFDAARSYLGEDLMPEQVLDARPEARLVLLGHTHRHGAWARVERDGPLTAANVDTDVDLRSFDVAVVNVGSVDYPRDGDPRAVWFELELDRDDVPVRGRWHRCAYDVARYQASMAACELPAWPCA